MFQIAEAPVDMQICVRKSASGSVFVAPSKPKTAVKDGLRAAQKRYLAEVRDRTSQTLTQIARIGDMNPSTLTRFFNDTNHKGTLATLTLSMIADRTGIPVPPDALDRPLSTVGVMREREAEAYIAAPEDTITPAVTAFIAGRNGIDPWTLRSRALEYEGYMPGDVLLVDLNAKPVAGDIVCAQLYDWQRGGADTIFRIFSPPILIGAGPIEAARRPRFVDDENVVIKGVVMMSFRRRGPRATA